MKFRMSSNNHSNPASTRSLEITFISAFSLGSAESVIMGVAILASLRHARKSCLVPLYLTESRQRRAVKIHRGSSVWSCVAFIYVRFLSNSRSDRQVGIKYQLQGLCRTKDSGFDWHIEVAGGVAKTAIGLNKLLQALSIMFSFYNGQFYIFSFFIKIYN